MSLFLPPESERIACLTAAIFAIVPVNIIYSANQDITKIQGVTDMPSIAGTKKMLDLTSLAFLFVAFLTGIAGALQTPTLSLFLINEVHTRPSMVGLFFTVSAVIGILISQFLAGRSDKTGDRKNLIIFCCMLGMLACLLFAWDRNYFILLFIGVFLSSFGSTATPQMFALAREYAEHTGRRAAIFSSILRAQVSLAWVVGPPVAYMLAIGFSFAVMYLAAGVAFIICGVMVWIFLPSMKKNIPMKKCSVVALQYSRRDTLLLFVICTLMWGTFSLYVINMPLFVFNELHLPEKLAGIMLSTAAGLEIPTMLIAGYFAKRLGKRLLMRVAVVAGFFFYTGMLLAHSPIILLSLQLLNAIYIGILGGIGMLYFQDLMPGQAGSATTLYTNTLRVGWIIAGLVAGIVAEIWNYHAVFWFALVMILAAIVCLLYIRDI